MATVGSYNYQTAKEKTVTTTGNIDDLDLEGAGLLRMNNASLSTIRGLKAGYAGQEVTVVSIGAGQVDLAHQNAGSLTGSRLINTVTSASTSLAAGSGMATYKYDETTARWRLLTHTQGAGISFTPLLRFNGGTTGITYTVQVAQYVLRGVNVYVEGRIALSSKGSSVGAAEIAGLPFTSVNQSNQFGGMFPTNFGGFGTAFANITVYIQPNVAYGNMFNPAGAANIANTDFTNTTDFAWVGEYRAS